MKTKILRFSAAIIVFSLMLTSCKDSKKRSVEKIVSEWIGKEIKFPNDLPCMQGGGDSACPSLNTGTHKIVHYIDSLGCTSCKLNLMLWKIYKEEIDSLSKNQVELLFFFSA